jgi:hypothetical protein
MLVKNENTMNMNTTLILRKKTSKLLGLVAVAFFVFSSLPVYAQQSLTLSISPSLFDMSVNPGQEWRSTLRIINVNDYDLTVYIDVVNFMPQGESGDGRFLPIEGDKGDGVTLAEWFSITKEAVVIPREQSKEVPFSVRVPFEASPGGHFAAILVGTKPPTPEPGQAKVQTSQMVTSLFFARVAGDIKELGSIREFTTVDTYLGSPEATFDLRFENKGNVHLQPQGEITITNMWGQERGIIPINQSSQFGNVLPNSIRKFTFSWKGEWSFSDIGRYTAKATLAYGTEARQFSSSETYFWVIPFKLLFGILIGLALFIALITWFVRLYVRHMLVMAGINIEEYNAAKKQGLVITKLAHNKPVKISAPVEMGFQDLKNRLGTAVTIKEYANQLMVFVMKYKLFFIGVFSVMLFVGVIVWYIASANTEHRGFEVSYVNSDADVTLTSEELIYNQLRNEREVEEREPNSDLPKIRIVNRSGTPGFGAETRIKLEGLGYEITSLEADFSSRQTRTVVIYPAGQDTEALRLSSVLNNAPISTYEEAARVEYLTVFVGGDMQNN